jgi:hypothetical protein
MHSSRSPDTASTPGAKEKPGKRESARPQAAAQKRRAVEATAVRPIPEPPMRSRPAIASLHLGQLVQIGVLAFGLVIGYLAGRWSGSREAAPLVQICERLDVANRLDQQLSDQQPATTELRQQLETLLAQCRAALSELADKNG